MTGSTQWITCGGCETRWTGMKVAHCGSCHLSFSGISAFDKHQTMEGCVPPESVGLHVEEKHWGECWARTYTEAQWAAYRAKTGRAG